MARTTILAATLAALPMSIPGSGIEWTPYYQEALRQADASEKVIFIAVNMDGEAANDEMVKSVYRDKRVVELSAKTINLIASTDDHSGSDCKRFGSLTCENHRRIAADLRGQVVKYNKAGRLVAPQHVFLSPEGEVLLSVPYGISADELVWCFATALLEVDPEADVPARDELHPPLRLIMKDVCNSGVYSDFVCPLSEKDLQETITELRSGWGAIEDMERFGRILATDHPEAITFATTELGSGVTAYSSEVTSSMIRTVARFSPPSFWESLEPCLKHHGRDVRCEAAAALEQLGAKKSLSMIRRCLSSEDDVVVQKNLVRAMGAAGADSSSVAKTLMKYGESDDERLIRLNAYLALGYHAGRENVHEFLVEALKDEDPEVRQAAAMAMAFSRIDTYRQAIVDAREKEPSEEVKSLFDRSVAVLDGENLRVFARDYRHIGGDDVPRARYLGP